MDQIRGNDCDSGNRVFLLEVDLLICYSYFTAYSKRIMEKLQLGGQKGVVKEKLKVRYGECERNHAVNTGGVVVDGCKEFIANDENGGSALTCSCCGCHRNFHRKVKETDQKSFGVEEQKEKKTRKLTSKVWDDFTKSVDEDGKEWAICNHCEWKFDGSSKKGTTHLKKHLMSMKCRAKKNGGDENEDISTQTRDLVTPTLVVMKEKSAVIDLINQSFDEDGEFTEHWDPLLLNSRKDEILQVYQEEKEKQDKFLNKLSCGMSLHIVYVCDTLILMVHYIDDSWERQIKIISIIPSENYIGDMIKSCLDLKIDRNICSIRYDGLMIDDDDEEEIIESWFSQQCSLPFAGVGLDFHGFCYKIELFADEWEMNEIDGVRECVEYGYKTLSNNLKLQHAVNNAETMGKKVIYDDDPCFFGPFCYLELGVGLKEAFSELEKIDSDFTSINLTNQKWDEVTATFEHWKELKEFPSRYCRDNSSDITPIVVDILKLFGFHSSEDCQICKNASYKKLFDMIQVYLVLIILDPRVKMDIIQRCYKEIHGSDADGYLEKTLKDFRDIYNEYAKDSSEYYKMMDVMRRPGTSSTTSELDLYLHHPKVPAVEGFDTLAWWSRNAPFYPTLARMARHYLAIPIDIDSAFFEEINGIKYCSEIDGDIKSALIYLRGLLYY